MSKIQVHSGAWKSLYSKENNPMEILWILDIYFSCDTTEVAKCENRNEVLGW